MKSALDNATVVAQYLVGLGRIIGPISPGQVPASTQLSPIGVIPKSSQPGKWRLIVDLSSPHGRSEPELCSLEYLRLDEVVGLIATSGRGIQLVIASAYRMVPAHPDDRPIHRLQRRVCRKHDLECLLGHLQHAAMVVRPWRTFVRRLIELLSAFRSREHWIGLGCTVRLDLQWWSCFMEGME
jgi:hypothetical protein